MRKTIAVVSATGALLFGGAGVANATVDNAPASSSTTTTLADNTNTNTTGDQHSDKSGLWGLLGLLGLGGLAGLKRRRDADAVSGVATPTRRPGV
ncbi:WGxxGxxG family protein [Mycobacterium sp.]|uniref:WGxxGxxG family protein n=1 Tax=Mycobacterium sp. TaxID=1785 RepID=UPI0025D43237|nr:WGxxGxxG family protein [Mycobacterium sp.]MBW0014525.1 LPXTG cell wall anchor domain-containing protein [Mycobacterium sp.]